MVLPFTDTSNQIEEEVKQKQSASILNHFMWSQRLNASRKDFFKHQVSSRHIRLFCAF